MATGSKFNAEQERLHNQLLTEINDHVDTNSNEYRAFRMQITKPLGGPGVLGRCKDLFDIFRNLSKRSGNLGILKYDVLKKAFKASNNEDIVELIEEKEKEIRKAGDPEEPINTATTARQRKAIDCEEATPRKILKLEKEDTDPSDGKFFQEEGLGYYETNKKKGYLLILNFSKDRNFTEHDVSSLKSFFEEELKFDVDSPRDHWEDDLTTKELEECLESIRTRLSSDYTSKKYYCFMCAILSHGNQGIIKTKDGKYEIERIRKMFGNKYMEKFAGKPKIFFIQACQGAATQTSVETNDESDDEARETTREEIDESDVHVAIPNDADVLLAYATTPGNKAFRRKDVGSWFIAECISVFKEFKEQCHLEDMMVTVRERVALNWEKVTDKGKQMPYTWSTLTKRLRLSKSQC